MAASRFVRFEGGSAPTSEELGIALEDFLGLIALRVFWDTDRWYAQLLGTNSWPLKRLLGPGHPSFAVHEESAKIDRWIEVWRDDECVDVMTRMADSATSALADGFAALVARHWGGKLEPR